MFFDNCDLIRKQTSIILLDYITLNKARRNKEENEHKGKKEK
jgi:hypothetical protein